MDYGQPVQQNASPEFFSSGQGTNNPDLNNFEPENNLNAENWNLQIDRNPGNIGNAAMSSMASSDNPLPLPGAEIPSMPDEVYHPTAENLTQPNYPNPNYLQPDYAQPSNLQPPYGAAPAPELGQITESPHSGATSVSQIDKAELKDFTRKNSMSGDKLSDQAIAKLQDKIKQSEDSNNFAALSDFLAEAREEFQGRTA